MTDHELYVKLERILNEAASLQREKVLRIARESVPYLTADDILNPQDRPELFNDPRYNFEDGILAGLVSAQMVVRSEYNRLVDAVAPGDPGKYNSPFPPK